MNLSFSANDYFTLIPALMLAIFGCAVLLFDALPIMWAKGAKKDRRVLLMIMLAGLVTCGVGLWKQYLFVAEHGIQLTGFGGSLTIDGFSIFFNAIFTVASAIVGIVSYKYLDIEGEHHGEYYALILFAQCGMYFLATGSDLVTLFIGLELMALTFYVMVGFLRGEKRSNEAAIKYLLLGAFSSGFLAYGFSVLYGISNSTKLDQIAIEIGNRPSGDPVVFLAFATTAVGLLFKISAVPFHMWAPDAYEGAPTTVTAYLSTASKAASFAFLLRLFALHGPFDVVRGMWEPVFALIAIATMTIGNLAAINQTNIKRLLAYSSISHAGYMLMGLIAGNKTGLTGIAVYVMVYTFMNLGAFMVVIALRRKNIIGEDLDDFAGLIHKSPGAAVLMLIFLLSLAGIPPTAGFFGKYFIFLALVETGHWALAIVGVLYAAVAIYYYFKIVRSMFAREATERTPLATSFGLRLALGVSGLLTLAIGVYPEPFLRIARFAFER